jgi:hypothetical protein
MHSKNIQEPLALVDEQLSLGTFTKYSVCNSREAIITYFARVSYIFAI